MPEVADDLDLLLPNVEEELRALGERIAHREEMSAWYWDRSVPVAEIVEAYGLASEHELRSLIYPLDTGHICTTCERAIYATSRTHYDDTVVASGGGKRRSWAPHPCLDCRAREKQEQEERSRRWFEERWLAYTQRRQRLSELATMPYDEYLSTPEWQATRTDALRRARYRCQVCNRGDRLDVHHRTYERRGQEWASDLTVLCRDCHARHHGKAA